jgi:hypothetical protein
LRSETRLSIRYFVMEIANGRDLFYGVVQHYAGNDPRGYSEADTVKVCVGAHSRMPNLTCCRS